MKKILVVDDDPDILEVVNLVLTTEGYAAEGTTKGDDAYHKISENKPDLIVLDVLLSGNDGRTICKSLKQDDTTKNIPVIMMSAHPNAKESVKACGADSFIPKPFSVDDLLNTVSTYIGEA